MAINFPRISCYKSRYHLKALWDDAPPVRLKTSLSFLSPRQETVPGSALRSTGPGWLISLWICVLPGSCGCLHTGCRWKLPDSRMPILDLLRAENSDNVRRFQSNDTNMLDHAPSWGAKTESFKNVSQHENKPGFSREDESLLIKAAGIWEQRGRS